MKWDRQYAGFAPARQDEYEYRAELARVMRRLGAASSPPRHRPLIKPSHWAFLSVLVIGAGLAALLVTVFLNQA